MDSRIQICRVVTDFKPKKFWKYFLEECQVTKLSMLHPGEEVQFEIPGDKEFSLSCVGEMPEKVIVEGSKIRINMPVGECILFFKFLTDNKINLPEQVTEVAINF